MPSGGLDRRISEMEGRGYRVHSRGTTTAVLTRHRDRGRAPVHIAGLLAGLALAAFGLWRGSWAFIAVGALAALISLADLWLRRRTMTVRLTVDDSGNVRQELIKLGDA